MATLPQAKGGDAKTLSAYNQRALAKDPSLAARYGVTSTPGQTPQNKITAPPKQDYGVANASVDEAKSYAASIPDIYGAQTKELNKELPQIQQRYQGLLKNLNDQVTSQLKTSMGTYNAQAAAAGVAPIQGTQEMAAQQSITQKSNDYLGQQQNVLNSNQSAEEQAVRQQMANVLTQQSAAQQQAQAQIAQAEQYGLTYKQTTDLATQQAQAQQQQFEQQMALYKQQADSGGGSAGGTLTMPTTGVTLSPAATKQVTSLQTKATANLQKVFDTQKSNLTELASAWGQSWNQLRLALPKDQASDTDIDAILGYPDGWSGISADFYQKKGGVGGTGANLFSSQ
jgi:hypothetical protein